MALLSGQGRSQITAQPSIVSTIRLDSASVSTGVYTNGQQIEVRNGNASVIGNWVNPPTSASEWEVRAVLDSGDVPDGVLGTWLSLSANREWGFILNSEGTLTCSFTLEFRRVGDTSPEVTVSNNFLSLEVLPRF
jgi:hypothetical protein